LQFRALAPAGNPKASAAAVKDGWTELSHALRGGNKPAKLLFTARQVQAIEAALPSQGSFGVWQLAPLWGCHKSRILTLIEQGELFAFDLRGKNSSRSNNQDSAKFDHRILAVAADVRQQRKRARRH
jgi:hypothetical protein